MSNQKTVVIALEDMEFFAYHGVYPEENKVGRNYRVSVYLNCAVDIDGTDDLASSYNYEWIYEIANEEMNTPRKLLETVAFHMARKLRQKSDLLQSGEIKIYKEGLPLAGKVGRSLIVYQI